MGDVTLIHHGIKGQKWGIRRYQNPDGSLTAAGRKRYGVNGEIDDTYHVPTSYKSQGYVGKTTVADYKNMKKEDLKEMVERMELENRYLRAVDARKGKPYVEQVAARMNTIGQILDSTNKVLQFTTGKNFSQKIAEITEKSTKTGLSKEDMSDLFDDLSYKINRDHKPSVEVQNRLTDLGYSISGGKKGK